MRPLPRQVTEDLRAAGWVDGPWRRDEAQRRTLEQLPVAVDSWDAFDQLFDWRSRPVAAGGTATCASYLGAAVRRFFAQGGRRAIVVRVGRSVAVHGRPRQPGREPHGAHRPAGAAVRDPVPALRCQPTRAPGRGSSTSTDCRTPAWSACPISPTPARGDPAPPDATLPLVPIGEGFVECSHSEAVPPDDLALRYLHAPRSDAAGLVDWTGALAATRAFLLPPSEAMSC